MAEKAHQGLSFFDWEKQMESSWENQIESSWENQIESSQENQMESSRENQIESGRNAPMKPGVAPGIFQEPDANTSFERVYQVVRQIPEGCVATYGQVARLAGNKKWSRVVGYALHVNPEPGKIPCHRVVNRLGEPSTAFAFGGVNRQIELLEAEGVTFVEGKVDMKTYQWNM